MLVFILATSRSLFLNKKNTYSIRLLLLPEMKLFAKIVYFNVIQAKKRNIFILF